MSRALLPGDLRIRHAIAADAPSIIAGINAVCAERMYFHTPHYVPTPQWEAVLYQAQRVPDHLLLLAETLDGELIGATQLLPDALCVQTTGLMGEVGIFVLCPFRDHGVGTVLLGELLRQATIQHYAAVWLAVLASNYRALRLYRKFDFVIEYRRRRRYAFLGEQDELVMARSLPL